MINTRKLIFEMNMKNQKGFIQMPILVIIAGVLILGGVGYVGVKQYQNYQVEKMEKERIVQEKEKDAQALAEVHKRSLEEVRQEDEEKSAQPEPENPVVSESEKSRLCKPLFSGPIHTEDGKINIVFTGFGYQEDSDVPPKEAVPLLANIVVDPLGKNQGLFSVEPFKSNRDKFNFWYVDKLGEMKFQDCGSLAGLCFQDPDSLSENCAVPNKFVVNFVNKIGVLNRGGGRASTISAPTGQDILKTPQNLIQMAKIFVHEFGGHGIGGLLDEYDFSHTGQQFKDEVHFPNCYAGPKHTLEEASQNAPWRDLIGNGCGKEGVIDCSDKDVNYNIEVGVFEGCAGYSFGIFRPTRYSIMRNPDMPPPYSFGPWNEQLIKEKIIQIIK